MGWAATKSQNSVTGPKSSTDQGNLMLLYASTSYCNLNTLVIQ